MAKVVTFAAMSGAQNNIISTQLGGQNVCSLKRCKVYCTFPV